MAPPSPPPPFDSITATTHDSIITTLNTISRYFYLICFATYAKEQGPELFPKTFVAWMDEHKELRDMVAAGKDKLEWSRQVDQGAVDQLRSKIGGSDYKEKWVEGWWWLGR